MGSKEQGAGSGEQEATCGIERKSYSRDQNNTSTAIPEGDRTRAGRKAGSSYCPLDFNFRMNASSILLSCSSGELGAGSTVTSGGLGAGSIK